MRVTLANTDALVDRSLPPRSNPPIERVPLNSAREFFCILIRPEALVKSWKKPTKFGAERGNPRLQLFYESGLHLDAGG